MFYLLINPPRDLQKNVVKYVYDCFELRQIKKNEIMSTIAM